MVQTFPLLWYFRPHRICCDININKQPCKLCRSMCATSYYWFNKKKIVSITTLLAKDLVLNFTRISLALKEFEQFSKHKRDYKIMVFSMTIYIRKLYLNWFQKPITCGHLKPETLLFALFYLSKYVISSNIMYYNMTFWRDLRPQLGLHSVQHNARVYCNIS